MMNLKHATIKTRKRQAGMTLLELTVVLLVLIGLSGLILPYAQGYLQRTHDSTGNDNLWELNNAINLFYTKYFEQPAGYHTLVTGAGSIYGKLMNPSLVDVKTYTEDSNTTTAATEIPLASLMMAGLAGADNKLWNMKSNPTSATFDAVSTQVMVPMPNSGSGSSVTLAVVTQTDIDGDGTNESVAQHLAYAFYNNTGAASNFDTTCYDYVVFGVGPETEMVGKVISDAPLHFASSGSMGPEKRYNRFVAVYQVDKDNSTSGCSENTEPAKLVGSAMLMMQPHLWGLAHTQGHTYENLANKNN